MTACGDATARQWTVRGQSLFESIAILDGDEVILEMEDGPETRPIADLIVRAVNERDELIEALADIIPRFEKCCRACGSDDEFIKEATAKARAALARAEGRQP